MRTLPSALGFVLLTLGCAPDLVLATVPRDGAAPGDGAAATDAPPAADAPAAPDVATATDSGNAAPDVVTVTDAGSPVVDVPTVVDAGSPVVDVPVVVDAGSPVVDVPTVVDAGTPVVDVPVVTDTGPTEGPPSNVVDGLIGTWATRTRTLTEQTVPVIGAVRTTSSAYGIAVFARAGSSVTLTERACRVVFDRSTLGQTSIEDRAVQALAPFTAPIAFARAGAAWRWSRAARSVAVGWNPRTNPDEMLPTARTDPRVIDSDGDGNPGVSVRIMSLLASGTVYVVQTQRSALSGDQATDLTPRAVNDPTGSTQRTVGASTNLLAQDIPSRVDATPANNVVTFARVANGADCAAVIGALSTLFR